MNFSSCLGPARCQEPIKFISPEFVSHLGERCQEPINPFNSEFTIVIFTHFKEVVWKLKKIAMYW